MRQLLCFLPILVCLALSSTAMADTVKIATVHFGPVLGDISGNRARLVNLTSEAAQAGAKIIVHTEMATSGYSFFSRQQVSGSAETVPGPSTDAIGAIAKQYSVYVALGLPEYEPDTGLYYNSAVLIAPDGSIAGVYRKRNNLLEASYNAEDYGSVPTFNTPYGTLGLVICADLFYAEFPREAAISGADILLAPANVSVTSSFLQVRSFENDMAVVVANRYGQGLQGEDLDFFNQDTFTIASPFAYNFEGATSIIMSDSGQTLSSITGNSDQIGYGELQIRTSRTLPVVRRPSLYSLIAQDTLEGYTFTQMGLPDATTFGAAALDPGSSTTPWAAAATAVQNALTTAAQQNISLSLAVLPAGYFSTVDPSGVAALQNLSTTNSLDILINVSGTSPPLSMLLTPEGQTYTYKRTHRTPDSSIAPDTLSSDYWVVDRPYARLSLMQDVDMIPPETSMVLAKMGVDVIAINADSPNPVLSAMWQSRTGSNAHIIVANKSAEEGIYRGGYKVQPTYKEAEGLVILMLNTANVRSKAFPRFMDPRQLLEPCTSSSC